MCIATNTLYFRWPTGVYGQFRRSGPSRLAARRPFRENNRGCVPSAIPRQDPPATPPPRRDVQTTCDESLFRCFGCWSGAPLSRPGAETIRLLPTRPSFLFRTAARRWQATGALPRNQRNSFCRCTGCRGISGKRNGLWIAPVHVTGATSAWREASAARPCYRKSRTAYQHRAVCPKAARSQARAPLRRKTVLRYIIKGFCLKVARPKAQAPLRRNPFLQQGIQYFRPTRLPAHKSQLSHGNANICDYKLPKSGGQYGP